jgi:hypothetical protein
MGKTRNACKIWIDTLKGRDHLRRLDIGGKIILKYVLEKFF